MVTETTAIEIQGLVRQYFKGGIKSSNKRYTAEGPKSAGRAKSLETAGDSIQNFRDVTTKGLNLWLKAQEVAKLGTGGSVFGNCSEMALLACYHAYQKDVTVGFRLGLRGADHMFCLVGPESKPPWPNILAMNKWQGDEAWIIDPWANICCRPQDFLGQYTKKMIYWSEKHKQIQAAGKWVDQTSGGYLDNFANEELVIQCVYDRRMMK
jgi:hypothetical protein